MVQIAQEFVENANVRISATVSLVNVQMDASQGFFLTNAQKVSYGLMQEYMNPSCV